MPSLNQAVFIREAINSVLSQKHKSLELIVMDGGSSDGTVELLRQYDDRVRWTSEPDDGQVNALNAGLRIASGELFGFLNSDDLLLPGALAAVDEFFREDAQRQWICGNSLLFGDGHRTEYVIANVPRAARQLLTWRYRAPQPGMFWRRSALPAEGFDERWQFDFDHEMYLRLVTRGLRCWHMDLPIAAYRLHQDSKTVAQAHAMDAEFDSIAQLYEDLVAPSTKRASKALREVRSAAQPETGAREATQLLWSAGRRSPSVIPRRAFWAAAKRAIRKGRGGG